MGRNVHGGGSTLTTTPQSASNTAGQTSEPATQTSGPRKAPSSASAADIADDTVATIGSVEFISLNEAISIAQDGETIVLHKDVKGYFPIEEKTLTIDLNGKTVTAAESGTMFGTRNLIRAFQVTGGNVTIKNGTITGGNSAGYVSTYDSADSSYKFMYWGGALSVYEGANVTLEDLTITGNSGTCIMALDNTSLIFNNCKVTNNNGESNFGTGYGIVYTAKSWSKAAGALLTMNDTEVSGMTGTKGAAPLFLEGGSATLVNCDIKNNTASYSGGIYFAPVDSSAKLTLNNTTVSGNTGYNSSTSRTDSGIGGLYLSAGSVELINSAIYNNTSAGSLLSAGDIVLSGNSTASLAPASSMVDHGTPLEGYVYRNGVSGEVLENGVAGTTHTGSFSVKPADQFDVVKPSDNTGAWEYGGSTYDSLAAAASAYIGDSGAGGEIKLLKDVTENDVLPAIGTAASPAVVNLNGKTMQALSRQQTAIELNGKAHVTVKDGTISGGRLGIDVKTVGSVLNATNVVFKDHARNAINAGTTATADNLTTLKVDGCTFEGNGFSGLASLSGATADRNGAYAVNWNGHFDISGDTKFIGNNGGITFFDPSTTTPSTLSNVTFTKNKWICFNAGTNSISISYQKPVTLTDCDFIENEPRGGYVIYFNAKNKALKLVNCDIKNNVGSLKTVYFESGYTATFNDCEISGNTAVGTASTGPGQSPTAGIHSALTGTITYPLTLYNTIIKDNVATTEYAASESTNNWPTGGVYANSTVKVNGSSAIYNNRGYSTATPGMAANDFFLAKSKSQTVPAAKTMKDGDFDFTNYVWVNAKEADPITTALSGSKSDIRLLTAEPYKELNVARIGETEYKTLEEAFAAANGGDLIEIILREHRPLLKYLRPASIDVSKQVTLDLNGIIIEGGDETAFTVKDGGALTVKDSLSDYYDNNGGVWATVAAQYITVDRNKMGGITKKLVVEDGGKLAIESTIVAPQFEHYGDSLSLTKVVIGTKRTVGTPGTDYGIFITLGKDKYVELGDAWAPVTTRAMWEPRITFTLDADVLADLNDEDKIIKDVVLTHGGGERIKLEGQTKVNGLTASNVRRVYTEAIDEDDSGLAGKFVLRKDLGFIYLDEVDGEDIADGADGTINNPIKTFEEAKTKLENNEEYGGIIVKNLVTIDSGESWDLSSCGERNNLFRWEEYTGNLIKVTETGSLTLTNIVVDGQGIKCGEGLTPGDGSLIYVEPHGALTLGAGSKLINNHIQNVNAYTSCGGAVYSAGDITILGAAQQMRAASAKRLAATSVNAGASISDNSAIMGGGIYQVGKVPGQEDADYTGTITMTGGTVAHNIAVYPEGYERASLMPAGGGIMLAYGADMCFSGGDISYNISQHIGGGISLGTTGIAATTCLAASGTTSLSMYGTALINGNRANGEGGGIYVQINSEAYVTKGVISNNRASGNWPYPSPDDVPEPGKAGFARDWSHGGGGIYVNGCSTRYYNRNIESLGSAYKEYNPGTLYLNDAEIAYNDTNTNNSRGGSALAFCATGEANLFELHGGVIHDNYDNHGIDVYMTTVDHQTGANVGTQLDNLDYYVTQYTADGTPYNWEVVEFDGAGFMTTGEITPVTDAAMVQGNNIRLALHSDLSEKTTDLKEAIANTKVHIVYNSSTHRGGGIGSNGSVVSGYEVPKIDVTAKKAWNDASLKSERPETVKFILQRKAENEPDSAFKDFMTAEINGQEDNWKVEWKDLPEYKEYKGSMPNSPACEDCVNGADTEDVKWEYRVVEDGAYMPDVEGSTLWTGPAYEESANGASLADIYDFETKAEDDTVRAAKDTPADYKFNDGKITVKNFTITNTPKAGKLQVSKEVVGNNADTSKEFSFKVELNTAAINGAKLNGTFGEMEFKDNVATFTLKNGETKTAENLPINVTYKVTETDYVDAGYDTTIVDNYGTTETELADGCGVIVANEVTTEGETIDNTAKVAFTNARNTYGNLTVKKVETGNATGEVKDFEFSVTLKDAAGKALANQTFGKDANALTTNANGQIEFTLAAGASKTIYSLPHGTQYEIVEASYAAQGYDAVVWTDESGATVEKASGTIVGGTAENPRLNSSVAFTATNNRNTYGNLELTKTVAGNAADSNKEFSFTISLAGLEPGAEYSVTGATTSTIKATAEGTAEATIGLKAGQTALVEKLPNGASYTVSEASYTEDGYASVIKGQAGAVAQGTIAGDSTASAAATDSYEFVNTRNANGSLTIAKLLQGNSIASVLDQQFSFTLEVTGAGVDSAALAQATASKTASGSSEATVVQLSFTDGKATFTLAGGEQLLVEGLPHGAAYAITETDPGADYVVTQEGATGTISETAARVATFTNTKDSFGNLAVSKTVKEYAEANKDYAFTITLSDKSISGTYGEMGFVNGVANFTLQGGQTKVAEGLPNGVGYTVAEADYSAEEYTTESTDATGTIVGNETQTAAFTNTKYGKGNLEIKKTIAGETEGEEDREFEFRVVLDNVSVNGLYSGIAFNEGVSEPIKVKANSSKLIEGLPADAKFSVTEKDYSADRYTTTSEGSTGSIAAEKTATASFVNTKAPEPTPTVPVRVALVKHLVDALIHVEEFSFGLYDGETLLDTVYTTLGNHVETDEYSSYVEIAFKGLRFSAAGTYNYTIREHMTGGVQVVEGDEWNLKGFEPGYYKGGVKYDDQAYPVTIVVTEDEETGQLVADVQYLGADGNKHELVNEYSEEYVEIDEYDSHPNDGLHEPTPEPEPETPEKKPTPEPTKTPAKATPTTKTGPVRTADTNPVAPLTLAALAAAGTAAFAFTRRRKKD